MFNFLKTLFLKKPLMKITFKQVGRNLNLVIDNQPVTRTGSKEELAPIKEAVMAYNEKPIKKNLDALKKLVFPASAAKEQKISETKAAIKKVKREVKSSKTAPKTIETVTVVAQIKEKIANNTLTDKEKEELRSLLQVKEKEVAAPKKVKNYRGEY